MDDRNLIVMANQQTWTFAKTYAKLLPHEYFLRKDNENLYLALKKAIDEGAVDVTLSVYGKVSHYRCLYLGKHRYWAYDTLINRTDRDSPLTVPVEKAPSPGQQRLI